MTQVINDKLKKCCNQCHKYMDGHCAWLSLGNEYCDEIMNVQQEIEKLEKKIKGLKGLKLRLITSNTAIKKENDQLHSIIKDVRKVITKYIKIIENGIDKGAYYVYIGNIQQKLYKCVEILDKVKEI